MHATYQPYAGWDECLTLHTDTIELIVTTQVGPRILSARSMDGKNLLYHHTDDLGKTGGDTWRLYGGHRFWIAPEDPARTLALDNQPVTVEAMDDQVSITAPIEAETGLQKSLTIRLSDEAASATIRHTVTNQADTATDLACWALTVMAQNGVAIAPLPPRGSHADNLLPTSSLILWAYTQLDDPRWSFGSDAIMLSQDPTNTTPQKIGLSPPIDWLAYALNDGLFVKTFEADPSATSPDMGSRAELFTNHQIMELESLGPLVTLLPGESAAWTETWLLVNDVTLPPTPSEAAAYIQSLL